MSDKNDKITRSDRFRMVIAVLTVIAASATGAVIDWLLMYLTRL